MNVIRLRSALINISGLSHDAVSQTYHPVNRQKLVSSLQTAVTVSDASWDDP